MLPKRIGFIGYPNVCALDLVGPLEAFSCASSKSGTAVYETVLIGLTGAPFSAESGVVLQPHVSLANVPELDTVVVPGGEGTTDPQTLQILSNWLLANSPGIRRVASVCTGICPLAEAGLLDGRRVTTHWECAQKIAARYPKLRMSEDSIYVKDGKFYTSAGITAGIDLALALVEEDLGQSGR